MYSTKAIKLLEGNIGENPDDLGYGDDILNNITKGGLPWWRSG